jgi:hypothetical protein
MGNCCSEKDEVKVTKIEKSFFDEDSCEQYEAIAVIPVFERHDIQLSSSNIAILNSRFMGTIYDSERSSR